MAVALSLNYQVAAQIARKTHFAGKTNADYKKT